MLPAKASLIIAILLLLCLHATAQPVEKIRKRYTNASEEYTVLKSDGHTKHGIYQQKTPDGKVLAEGYYNNGVQSGVWKQYNKNGKLISQGSYSDGYKAGVWAFHDARGKLVQKYDYTAQRLVYFKTDSRSKNKLYRVLTDNGIIDTELDRPPMFIGGEEVLMSLIRQNLSLYKALREINTTVMLLIKKNGEVTDHHFEKSSVYMDEDVLNAVKALPAFWIPGMVNGKPVDVMFELSVTIDKD